MTITSAQSQIASIQRDIQSLQRKLADTSRDEASKTGRIASLSKSISGATSPSAIASKARDIQRLQDDIASLQNKRAGVSKDVAHKTERLHRAQQDLYREQDKEQRKSFELLAQREKVRDQRLLAHLHEVTTPRVAMRSVPPTANYDAFISHASEDKEDLVRPLAEILKSSGHSIWYDEFQLRVGDSLRRSIDRGLAGSRFGIVVLSPAFFAKNWTQYELDGLVAKEMIGGKVILPLWHKVSKNEVLGYSPSLADKMALSTASYTIQELAEALSKVILDT
jgi:hypothetical protein